MEESMGVRVDPWSSKKGQDRGFLLVERAEIAGGESMGAG
jgi:hypothetical protein